MNLLSEQVEKDLYQSIINVVERTIEKSIERRESEQRYLKQHELMKYAGGVSKETVRKWVSMGLEEIKIGQVVMYDKKDIDHFMIKHKI